VDQVVRNVNIPIRKDIQNTLLWMAVARDRSKVISYLMALGADPFYRLPDNAATRANNIAGSSVFNMAEKLKKVSLYPYALQYLEQEINKCPDVAKIMKDNGKTIADIKTNVDTPIRKDIQNTLLWIASVRECFNLMDILIAMGANPYYKIPESSTNKNIVGMNIIEMLKKNNKPKSLEILRLSGFNIN
jgi:hypothetical protein